MRSYGGNVGIGGLPASLPNDVAPVCLLDVQTVDGLLYYWSDRPIGGVPNAISPTDFVTSSPYLAWLMAAPTFTFYRSLQTDAGSFSLQNISGDTLAADFEKATRRSALEGAFFVFRWWQPGGEFAWLEVHGTLTVQEVSKTSATLTALQLFPGQDDTPAGTYSENCQLVWKEKRCGATGDTECLYSYKTCQVTEHYVGILNNYEKNFEESLAPVITQTVNRRRGL